ncbi:MAG TPA: mechanosensitive ion channel, partial [Ilumatobacteraceae bacterium]|nr:mechanosensitive ion channel [Ilumatobacteraceae bacterium]
ILLILAVAVLITMALRMVVNRWLGRVFGALGSADSRSSARQRAVASVLRSAIVGVIWSLVVFSLLDEVGVNVSGLVATATVIGGAIAFGAQTLIRDVISGLYVLIEDQYGVGDEVDLGLASGIVERITLRSVRLRDFEGRVWHLAHGGVARVANLSKSPLAVLDLDVARDVDLEQLDRVLVELADELQREAGPLLTGPPRVVGLMKMLDDRLVYRMNAPTRPGMHGEVRRAWRLVALRAFQRGDLRAPEPAPAVPSPPGGSAATGEAHPTS